MHPVLGTSLFQGQQDGVRASIHLWLARTGGAPIAEPRLQVHSWVFPPAKSTGDVVLGSYSDPRFQPNPQHSARAELHARGADHPWSGAARKTVVCECHSLQVIIWITSLCLKILTPQRAPVHKAASLRLQHHRDVSNGQLLVSLTALELTKRLCGWWLLQSDIPPAALEQFRTVPMPGAFRGHSSLGITRITWQISSGGLNSCPSCDTS